MYSLKHSVNLSRRACWTLYFVIILTISCGVFVVNGFENNNNYNDAGDALTYPRPDLEPLPQDFKKPYKGVNFGPMGPTNMGDYQQSSKTDNIQTEKSKNDDDENNIYAEKLSSTTVKPDKKNKTVKRYPMASVSFHRVETPFIIGLWIFCASLAKIGKLNELK